jgi:hypothetical protein
MKKTKLFTAFLALGLSAGCSQSTVSELKEETASVQAEAEEESSAESDIQLSEYTDTGDGSHAIEADGTEASYSYIKVTKTGDSDGDEADFFGTNAAVYAYNGASLTIENAEIETDGKHANAVFSYGEGTAVTVSGSVIHTYGNCSGGLMTTGGGTMTADDLTVITEGNSSAAIRSDRGGGTVTVTGGYYESNGKGSPVIYSTADITVNDAQLVSGSAQGVVVEGKNSVTLNNVTLTASNTSKNSDRSSRFQAVMLYQSMSGDASKGTSSFVMNGGSLTNLNGSVFFVTNTSAVIELNNVTISNEGDFMNIEAAGWGKDGANGGHVTMKVTDQSFEGDITVDAISSLDLTLDEGTSYNGAILSEGETDVTMNSGSTWTLSADTYITSLSGDTSGLNLNGYSLYINGILYTA